MNDLLDKKCTPCEGGVIPFDISETSKGITPPSQGEHFLLNKSLIIFNGAGKGGRTLDLLVGNETLYH